MIYVKLFLQTKEERERDKETARPAKAEAVNNFERLLRHGFDCATRRRTQFKASDSLQMRATKLFPSPGACSVTSFCRGDPFVKARTAGALRKSKNTGNTSPCSSTHTVTPFFFVTCNTQTGSSAKRPRECNCTDSPYIIDCTRTIGHHRTTKHI